MKTQGLTIPMTETSPQGSAKPSPQNKWGFVLTFAIITLALAVTVILKIKEGDKFKDYRAGSKTERLMLTLSNIAYLLPIGVVIFGMVTRKISLVVGFELVTLLCMVIFFSVNHHLCEFNKTNSISDKCNGTFGYDNTFAVLDKFMAMFTMGVVMIHICNLTPEQTMLARMLLMAIILVPLSIDQKKGSMIAAVTIAILSGFVLKVIYNQHWNNTSTKWLFALSIGFSTFGFVLFEYWNQPRWLMHSLWHILSAIGAALMIAGFAQTE